MKERYLLDTGMMGHFINHRRGVDVRIREANQRGARIATCMPVVGELFFGVEWSKTRDAKLQRLQRALSQIVCWPFDRKAARDVRRDFD